MNILQSLSNLGWKEIGRYSKERQLTKTKIAIKKSQTRSGRVSALAGVESRRQKTRERLIHKTIRLKTLVLDPQATGCWMES